MHILIVERHKPVDDDMMHQTIVNDRQPEFIGGTHESKCC